MAKTGASLSALAQELALEREMALRAARKSFEAFCFYVWPGFATHWHIKLIARAVDDIANGDLYRLYLAMPPQFGKSTLLSVLTPAYLLGRNPNRRIFGASYAAALSTQLNRQVQRLMETSAYLEVFPETVIASLGTKAADAPLRTQSAFEVSHARGSLRSVGTLGSATGFSAETIIIDDAHKNADEASSPVTRERVWAWFQTVMMTRLQKNGALICLGTRWRTDDFLSGVLGQAQMQGASPQWRVIVLPAIAESSSESYDPRQPGEGLWDERFDVATLNERRKIIGERQFQALFQQNPVADESAIIKSSWLKWYDELPGDLTDYHFSADLTFEDKGDYTAIGVFARKGPNHYLVDLIEQRMDFVGQLQIFEALSGQYPHARVKLVEDAANGAALIALLRQKIGGIVAIRQKTSKVNRAIAASPTFEAGNFYLPKNAAWADRAAVQLTTFPAAANDDIVDCVTTYLNYAMQKAAAPRRVAGLSQPRAGAPRWR